MHKEVCITWVFQKYRKEGKWKRQSFDVIKSQSPHWNWAEAILFQMPQIFQHLHNPWKLCNEKPLSSRSQLRNVCFVWPPLAGAGRIKVMNKKKSGQSCKCLRLPCFWGEREKRYERVDWENCKCTLLGPKLGNIPRRWCIAVLKSQIVNLERERLSKISSWTSLKKYKWSASGTFQ